jgi:hypothetical protein
MYCPYLRLSIRLLLEQFFVPMRRIFLFRRFRIRFRRLGFWWVRLRFRIVKLLSNSPKWMWVQ